MTQKKTLEVPAHCKGMTFEEFKKEAFKDQNFVEEYEALRPEFEALEQRIRAKKRRGTLLYQGHDRYHCYHVTKHAVSDYKTGIVYATSALGAC